MHNISRQSLRAVFLPVVVLSTLVMPMACGAAETASSTDEFDAAFGIGEKIAREREREEQLRQLRVIQEELRRIRAQREKEGEAPARPKASDREMTVAKTVAVMTNKYELKHDVESGVGAEAAVHQRVLKRANAAVVASAVNALFGEGVAQVSSLSPETVSIDGMKCSCPDELSDIECAIECMDIRRDDLKFAIEILRVPNVQSVSEALISLQADMSAVQVVKRFEVDGAGCVGKERVDFRMRGRDVPFAIELKAYGVGGRAPASRFSLAWKAVCDSAGMSGTAVAEHLAPVVIGGCMAAEESGFLGIGHSVDTAYVLRVTLCDLSLKGDAK